MCTNWVYVHMITTDCTSVYNYLYVVICTCVCMCIDIQPHTHDWLNHEWYYISELLNSGISNTPSQCTCRSGVGGGFTQITYKGREMRYIILNITGTLLPMMCGGMMFCEVICVWITSFIPINFNFFLCRAIPEPMIPHVPRFWSFLSSVVMNKSISGGIIDLYRCRRLWMT